VRGDVGDGRPRDAAGGVVPAQAAAHRMLAGVEAVAAQRRDVDAADERDLAVDYHELLVVAVHRALVRVQRAAHARAARQPLAHVAHGRTVGREHRKRRAAPQQHAHVDALGQLAEQVAQPARIGLARQPELRRHVPAGDVHRRPRGGDRLGDQRQRAPAVDQNLKRVARARRRVAGGPQRAVVRRLELGQAPDSPQAPASVRAERQLDRTPGREVESIEQLRAHPREPTATCALDAAAGSRRARRRLSFAHAG
jgi:hypothetical protein